MKDAGVCDLGSGRSGIHVLQPWSAFATPPLPEAARSSIKHLDELAFLVWSTLLSGAGIRLNPSQAAANRN